MNATARRFFRNRTAAAATVVIALIAIVAIVGPALYPHDPFEMMATPFEPPFGTYFLGTDVLGRDVAAGLIYGARTSLTIALVASLAALLLGTLVGALSGYYGGLVDEVLMRCTEFFQTIPTFLFAVVIVAVLTPSITSIAISVAFVSWPPVARLVRAEFLSMRGREFVHAAECLGAPDWRILFQHILPNCLAPIIVMGSLMVAQAILLESALSFLGLSDGSFSWGYMIGAGRTFLRSAWWLCAIPGLAILITVLCINIIGEALNDALNPRLED